MTPHISAKKKEIANKVIMVGDPKRADFIATNYLSEYKIVSEVRANNIYTGKYKNKRVTIMASGMGMPSMGIYAYELYNVYNVSKIIRVGTCGAYDKDLSLFDIILVKSSYSETAFDLTDGNKNIDIVYPNNELNNQIIKKSKKLNLNIKLEDIVCTDSFYMDNVQKYFQRMPNNFKPAAAEMESYALFYLAQKFNKEAACILTVSDIIGKAIATTPEEREKGLKQSILLALESI